MVFKYPKRLNSSWTSNNSLKKKKLSPARIALLHALNDPSFMVRLSELLDHWREIRATFSTRDLLSAYYVWVTSLSARNTRANDHAPRVQEHFRVQREEWPLMTVREHMPHCSSFLRMVSYPNHKGVCGGMTGFQCEDSAVKAVSESLWPGSVWQIVQVTGAASAGDPS